MKHIKQIIDYFFHHDIPSGELRERVYHRMSYPLKDEERDEAVKDIWTELGQNRVEDPQWEESFRRLEPSLQGWNRPRKHRLHLSPWMRIAAVWLVPFLMLCTSAYLYFNPSAGKSPVDVSYTQQYAAMGTREQITLPDGSSVWLNAGSTLIYPSSFLASERRVHLIGEGFFEVKKDSQHPFIVDTRYLKMEVLGTSFNVSAYPEDVSMRTTLQTGAVKVNVQGDSISYYLQPDEQLVYTPGSQTVEKLRVHASDYSDWRLGGLFFDNASFEEVIRTLRRTYGTKIYVRTPAYKNQQIYVHFNQDEALETIFEVLKLMIPELEYRITDEAVYIE